MENSSFLAIIPPLIVLGLGYLTKRIMFSLAFGILSASLIVCDFNVFDSFWFLLNIIKKNLEFDHFASWDLFWKIWNNFICIFLFLLGIIVTLIHASGSAHAYELFVKKRLKKKKHVEVSSLILSKILFIDDYFSSLTVGSVMKPIFDSFKIPRAKLAFLVDSMAAPLAILCPVSSWVAAIIGFLKDNGISTSNEENVRIIGSPLMIYLNVIPFVFYSILIVFFSWLIVLKKLSYGPMKSHEDHCLKTGDPFNSNPPKHSINIAPGTHSKMIDFIIPVMILLVSIVVSLLFSGGWHLYKPSCGLAEALRNSCAAKSLFLGGSFALLSITVFYLLRQKLTFKQLPFLYKRGVGMMIPAVLVLFLAWTLGDILRNNLHTGAFIANLIVNSTYMHFLPFLLFMGSSLTAFAIGSSWGTAAIMFPIGIELFLVINQSTLPVHATDIPFLYIVLGAILSGCVAGDHISPISDTTIMTATSTAMVHEDHVQTQIPYALPVIFVSALGFLLIGYLLQLQYSYFFSYVVTLTFSILSGTMIYLKLNQKN